MAAPESTLRRLQQTSNHLQGVLNSSQSNLSIVHGPLEPPLRAITLGDLLDEQVSIRPEKECLIVPFSNVRWTFSELQHQARILARGLLSFGVKRGDRIGILAGNCEEYVALFFAVGYVGGILVVLNSTYTAAEAHYALKHSGCKLLFAEEKYGRHANTQLLEELGHNTTDNKDLEELIILRGTYNGYPTYAEVMNERSARISKEALREARREVHTHDVCNLQYTSGSTGDPKAAMLTHHNLLNNSHSIGARLALTPTDILCCPPPLFHCFGLVLGLLACLNHGATMLLPSPTFSAPAVLSALQNYPITALHGVPAMFEELLSLPKPDGWTKPKGLRTGIVAGAPVPRSLMRRMVRELGMEGFTSSYGLTEASPTCFNATTDETIERKLMTVGKVLPHLHCKIVGRDGKIAKRGERGELCMSGYSLMKGYWKNQAKTDEALVKDEQGIVWLHTGDEAVLDKDGYCTITGRFKDIIIRGGENIYPVEIESRLVSHPSTHISRAAVIGIKHIKYGEVVGAFLLPSPTATNTSTTLRPSDEDIRSHVRAVLGRHKAPTHIFWIGDEQTGLTEMPQTGSGKVKKHVLRDVAQRLVDAAQVSRTSTKQELQNVDSERPQMDGAWDENGLWVGEEGVAGSAGSGIWAGWDLEEGLGGGVEYVFDENML